MRTLLLSSIVILASAIHFSEVFAENLATVPATPIKHLVVIFPENISFDHYFGTYPHAENPPNEPKWAALPNTPQVNGLGTALLTRNPNMANPANGAGATNPFRLDRSQAATADQDHSYTPEQMAFHAGLMDLFPKSLGRGASQRPGHRLPCTRPGSPWAILTGTQLLRCGIMRNASQ